MGRSVSFLSRAQAIVYIDFDGMYYDNAAECYHCDGDGRELPAAQALGVGIACTTCKGTGTVERLPDEWDWEHFTEDLTNVLMRRFPSLYDAEGWDDRETRIFLQNAHCEIGVSEYGGLVSVSMRAKEWEGYGENTDGLSEHWVKVARAGFTECLHKAYGEHALVRMGGFSDGTSVYERVSV